MSLTDVDNYWGGVHSVEEVHTVKHDNQEFIFNCNIQYKDDGSLLSIDTKYYKHYEHNEELGLLKKGEGTTSDTMNDLILSKFRIVLVYLNDRAA